MYRINPLMRDVLIMADEVIFHGPTRQTLDHRTVEQAIIVAEERFIRQALGSDFYDDLCEEKNVVVTSGNKTDLETEINASLPVGSDTVTLTIGDTVNAMEFLSSGNLVLWKKYLWKLTAECVLMMSIPDNYVQFGSEGVLHTLPPAGPMTGGGLTSPDLRTVKWAMDKKMMDRVDPLIEAMHAWLCKNRGIYTTYGKDCGCDANGVAYKRKSDIVLNIYDDEDEDCAPCVVKAYRQPPRPVGSGDQVTNEVPQGAINGINADYYTIVGFVSDSLAVTLNGQEQTQGDDYYITGPNSFHFYVSPGTGETVLVDYIKS